jgi:hypothetical protein
MAAAATPSSQPVRVVLRVRPFLPSEATSATAPCVSLLGSHPGGEVTVQLKGQHTRYAFSDRHTCLVGEKICLFNISNSRSTL